MKNIDEIVREIIILNLSQIPLKTRSIKTGIEINLDEWKGWDCLWLEFVDFPDRYIVREYWKYKIKKWEIEYKNGLRDGKEIHWNKNGNKHWEVPYKDDKRHGKATVWGEYGSVCEEAEFREGDKIK